MLLHTTGRHSSQCTCKLKINYNSYKLPIAIGLIPGILYLFIGSIGNSNNYNIDHNCYL